VEVPGHDLCWPDCPKVSSAAECQALCWAAPDCRTWSWKTDEDADPASWWDCDLKNCTLGLDCGEVGSNGTRYSGPKACTYNTFAAADGAERDDSWLLGLVLGLGYNAVFFGLCSIPCCIENAKKKKENGGRSGGEVRGAPPRTTSCAPPEKLGRPTPARPRPEPKAKVKPTGVPEGTLESDGTVESESQV